MRIPKPRITGWLTLFLVGLLAPSGTWAAPLRISAWNFQTSADTNAANSETRLRDAAAALKRDNPDLIILEQVADWQACSQLAQALKPAVYNVLLCSAFRDPRTGAASKQQLAILSKRKAYFSWSEAWPPDGSASPGGFAFAAFRNGGVKVGVFAVQLGDSLTSTASAQTPDASRARAAAIQQWVQSVQSFKDWVTNRVQAAVVAGTFNNVGNATPEAIRFMDTLLGAPLQRPLILPPANDHIAATLVADADDLPGVVLDRAPAVCEIAVNTASAPSVSVARAVAPLPNPPPAPSTPVAARPEPAPTLRNPVAVSAPPAPPTAPSKPANASQSATTATAAFPILWAAVAGIAMLILIVVAWTLSRRRMRELPASATLISIAAPSQSQSQGAAASTVIITPRSVTGSAAQSLDNAAAIRPIVHVESGGRTRDDSSDWKQRALEAEQRAERAQAALKAGLLPQLSRWLKQTFVRKLVSDRAELLETQHAATLKALAVDERLSRLEVQIQRQNLGYEQRIDELTRELAVAREENRELIRARIEQVKAEMAAARARLLREAGENQS
jgi:hypothetical protein